MKCRLSGLLIPGLYLALFLSCYASVLTVDYGFRDDYPDIFDGLERGIVKKMMLEGRPLYALLTKIHLQFTTNIDDLSHIRFVSVFSIALVAWSVFLALVRAGWGRLQSFCVGMVIGATLPFQVYAAWATAGFFPFAAFISGLGFLVGERAFGSRSARTRYPLAAASILMFLAALLIYQPAAMFFWVFVAIAVLKPDARPYDAMRRFGWHCMIGLTGILFAFVAYKLAVILYPTSYYIRPILDFQHVSDKIAWFFTDALPAVLVAALPYSRPRYPCDSGTFTPLIVVSLTIIGGIMFLRDASRDAPGGFSGKLAVAASLLLLTFMPNLVAAQNYVPYRALPGPAAMIVIYAFFSLQGYIGRLRRFRFRVLLANVVMMSVAASCAVAAARHVRVSIVVPQFQELEFIRFHLGTKSLSQVQGIYVIRPDPGSTHAPFWRYEFGTPSTSTKYEVGTPSTSTKYEFETPSTSIKWMHSPMVRLLLLEMSPEYAFVPVRSVGADGAITPHDSLVVDMRDLKKAVRVFGTTMPSGTGTPVIRSGFDVYFEGNALTYLRDTCTPGDTEERFFLHIVPVDVNDLPDGRRRHGFDNLDFDFDEQGMMLGGRCAARRVLPSYPVSAIRTGQYVIGEGRRIWDEEIHVLDRRSGSGR